ncbi:MAG: CcmD family protein [Gemmatimonadota bacterium]|nr:CcmD family protein [Gemmatimonadota bacterium]
MSRIVMRLVRAVPLAVFAALVLGAVVGAQESPFPVAQGMASQSLRPYAHVFIAYALAWIVVFGWVVSIGRRLARLDERLRD